MRRAFSLVEVMVVLAILAVLAALLYPVLQKAKSSGNEAACTSNLHQMHVALQLYRDQWEGTDEPAHTWEMGLPDIRSKNSFFEVINRLHCQGYSYPDGRGNPGYVFHWPLGSPGFGVDAGDVDKAQEEWKDYVANQGSASVTIFGPNHQTQTRISSLSLQRAFGVTLSGSVLRYVRRGDLTQMEWWKS